MQNAHLKILRSFQAKNTATPWTTCLCGFQSTAKIDAFVLRFLVAAHAYVHIHIYYAQMLCICYCCFNRFNVVFGCAVFIAATAVVAAPVGGFF